MVVVIVVVKESELISKSNLSVCSISADTWPHALNDEAARRDWSWAHHYDIDRLCRVMFMKMAQLEAEASSHVARETLLGAIHQEQTAEANKSASTEDNRSVLFAN